MNIFYLNESPSNCAQEHCDKHVVKMILEYAQLLSTAHRILDGSQYTAKTAANRNIKRWELSDSFLENTLYKASHVNHPSGIWTRANNENYTWLANLLCSLCEEYTHRYGKHHKVEETGLCYVLLKNLPKNIAIGKFTPPTPAMPDKYKIPNDSIRSYHAYYIHDKNRFAKWKNRTIPKWYSEGLNHANISVS